LTLTSVSVPAPGAMATALADTTSCQYGVAAYFADFTGANAEDTYLQDDGAGLHGLLSQVQSDAQCVFFDALDSKPALHAALDWYRANTSGRQLVGTTDAHVSVPTLLLWGDQDPYFCRATVDLTSQFVDGPYTLQVLAGINHWAPELDADTVSAAILAHLAGLDAGPALEASPPPDSAPGSALDP
jgi:pimeloyl-ACP methyl ester carboxylesterase